MTGAVALALTGANGFLGWHVRVLAHALRMPPPVLVSRADLADPARRPGLVAKLDGVDRVVHLAGVNRGDDEALWSGNVVTAQALARAVRACATPPKTVVFANSVHAGNTTGYGAAKAAAAQELAEATQEAGSAFVDLRLPNVFGEHCRAHYNSVIATFCRLLADGATPQVHDDRELELVHATDAAADLLGVGPAMPPVRRSVRQLETKLRELAETYRTGEIPELADRFDVRLFNTYRSYCFPQHYPMALPRHADARGELVEVVKAHGGGGQTFCSMTGPGMTRGEHYHLAKVERFAVVRGEAQICLRRLLHDDVVRLAVRGSDMVAVDMPTMWVHNLTNVGEGELVTLFWSNELFDPQRPDTYPEPVT